MGQCSETDSTHLKLPHICPRPSTDTTSVIGPHLELWWTLMFLYQTLLSHSLSLNLVPKRHTKILKQCLTFLICLCCGTDGYIKTVNHLNLVIIDLREYILLLYPH